MFSGGIDKQDQAEFFEFLELFQRKSIINRQFK